MAQELAKETSPSDLNPVGPGVAEFRHALGHFATGITVITTLTDDGELHGLTANSVTSVSLTPPLILFCIKNTARSLAVLQRRRAFSLHILTEDQERIAMGFASDVDRASICDWSKTARGLPLLSSFHMALECTIQEIYPGGDHAIVLARVSEIHRGNEEAGPLLFYKGKVVSMRGTHNS